MWWHTSKEKSTPYLHCISNFQVLTQLWHSRVAISFLTTPFANHAPLWVEELMQPQKWKIIFCRSKNYFPKLFPVNKMLFTWMLGIWLFVQVTTLEVVVYGEWAQPLDLKPITAPTVDIAPLSFVCPYKLIKSPFSLYYFVGLHRCESEVIP